MPQLLVYSKQMLGEVIHVLLVGRPFVALSPVEYLSFMFLAVLGLVQLVVCMTLCNFLMHFICLIVGNAQTDG